MIDGLKPYDDYRPSAHPWLGKVPAHWLEKRAKYFFREVDERSTTGEEDLLSVSHKTGVTPRPQHVTMFKAESNVGHKICRPADLAINTMWAFMGALGVSRQVGLVSPSYGIYRPINHGELHPNYVDRLLRTDDYKSEYLCRFTGIRSSRLRLYPDEFLKIPIPCPPQEEQAAIARFLDHADRRIRRYIRAKRQLIALLNEQKQAIIHRAVTRGLDPHVKLKPSGVEWLGDVPEHWEVLALKRALRELIDCEHKTAPAVDSSDFSVVRTSAVRNGRLHWQGTYFTTEEAFEEWTRRGKPEFRDVIFTREAPAGEACLVPENANLCLGQRTVLMKVRAAIYDAQFLVHMIYGGPPQERIKLLTQGSTVGHFNMDDIGWMPVLRPPMHEQESIVSFLSKSCKCLENAIVDSEKEIQFLKEYRTRLIADVVTGKLDVREAAAALPDELEAVESDAEELLDEDDTTDDVALDIEPEEVEA